MKHAIIIAAALALAACNPKQESSIMQQTIALSQVSMSFGYKCRARGISEEDCLKMLADVVREVTGTK